MFSGLVTTVARARLTWVKKTIIPDFIEIMTAMGIWNDDLYNKSDATIKINDGIIDFIGFDDPQKLHGKKQDIAWINEAIETSLKSFQQVAIRTKKRIILDYNPSMEAHWIYDKVIPRKDCKFIHSTYKDNPFLDPDIIAEIEMLEPTPENIKNGTADDVAWKIYGLGQRAAHRGLIHSKIETCAELPPKREWKWHCYGLDFGFTNDPTALVLIVFAHGCLYYKQLLYKKRLTNIKNPEQPSQDSIQAWLEKLEVPKNVEIFADSAEPKAIQDLKNCGYNVIPADKGQDSVKVGIETMHRYKGYITECSIDGIKERNNYKWKEDKDGNATNEPIDNFNHFWDASRYGVFMKLRERSGSFADLMS